MDQQKKARKIEGLLRKIEIKRDSLISELNRILHYKEDFEENEFEEGLDQIVNCSSKMDLLASFYAQLTQTGTDEQENESQETQSEEIEKQEDDNSSDS
jgi:hypothetical protein